MFGLGLPELIVIFFVIFVLFGAKALPEIAKSFGKAIKVFKKETNEITNQIKDSTDLDEKNNS